MQSIRWSVQHQNTSLVQRLADAMAVQPIIAHLLLNRGVTSLQAAHAYIAPPTHAGFPDAWLSDMARILDQLSAKSTVLLYGDYDVDGITATTVMRDIITALGHKPVYFIPDRFNDGYGLTDRVYDLVAQHKPDLLITLDCGITNKTECSVLKQRYPALKIVMIDHHQMPDIWPEADLIVNPKRLSSTHLYYDLCTVGIVQQFFKAVLATLGYAYDLNQHLDMVALGTIADIAQLSPYNRHLVRAGLSVARKGARVGLQALTTAAKIDLPRLSTRDIGFGIAPLLNAAGRLSNASICVQLLTTRDADTATALAVRLTQLNRDRRSLTTAIMTDAHAYLEANPSLCDSPVLVLMGRNWHAGVIGIVAARITDYYHRPSIVIGYDDTGGRGSARSIPSINIYDLIKANSTHLSRFGGHHQAAGFSLAIPALEPFQDAIIQHARQAVSSACLQPTLRIDAVLTAEQISYAFWESLTALSPFGSGNPEPVFMAELRVIEARLVGNGSHIKATFSDDAFTLRLDGIGFGLGDKLALFNQNRCYIAFNLHTNTWQNKTRLQLNILDVKA